MPFIMVKVSCAVSREQELELKAWLGKAIELVPGKSEAYLFAGFEDNCHLYLRGDNTEATAYVEVSVFGNEKHLGYEQLTAEITMMFVEVLGIAPDHVYIKYDDIQSWGVNGTFIDRNQYLQGAAL